eukprot:scaffold192108_cov27-Tisochrysis_lutea.AAC.1
MRRGPSHIRVDRGPWPHVPVEVSGGALLVRGRGIAAGKPRAALITRRADGGARAVVVGAIGVGGSALAARQPAHLRDVRCGVVTLNLPVWAAAAARRPAVSEQRQLALAAQSEGERNQQQGERSHRADG